MGYIEGQNRNQITLFPESIDDYISDQSTVRVIDEYIDQLDIGSLGFKKAVSPTMGRPPYDPKDMLRLYIYGYLNRIRSSRRLEHEAIRNIEVIWLLKKLKPDFKTIADFRKDNKKR
ncbi:MAG: transposase [Desulfotomaculaceae bacterium]